MKSPLCRVERYVASIKILVLMMGPPVDKFPKSILEIITVSKETVMISYDMVDNHLNLCIKSCRPVLFNDEVN